MPAMHEQFKKLYLECLQPNACLERGDDDEVTVLMRDEALQACFSERSTAAVPQGVEDLAVRVQRGFQALRREENSALEEAQQRTINVEAYSDWLYKGKVINEHFTAADARKIFVRVNLDDELNVQQDKNDTAEGLTLDEFQECLVRIAVELGASELTREADGSISAPHLVPRLCALAERLFVAKPASPPAKAKGPRK